MFVLCACNFRHFFPVRLSSSIGVYQICRPPSQATSVLHLKCHTLGEGIQRSISTQAGAAEVVKELLERAYVGCGGGFRRGTA